MDAPHEQFNDRLEQVLRSPGSGTRDLTPATSALSEEAEAEVEALLGLARQVQNAPFLRVDPRFAQTLEQRVMERAQLTRPVLARRARSQPRRVRLVLLAAIIGITCLLLGLGIVFAGLRPSSPSASRRTPPTGALASPGLTAPASSTASPADLAMRDLALTRADLHQLSGLTAPTQTTAYLQALARFNTQFTSTMQAITALPAVTAKTTLLSQLTTLQMQSRQELRSFLPTLSSDAGAATTSTLGGLGESVPQVSSALLVLPAHPPGTATITLSGSNMQPGAFLLVDGKRLTATGTLQAGELVFVVAWPGKRHPHSLGLVNPDGTVAQTAQVTVTTATSNGKGQGHGKG